jgi:hypothetical protein
VSVAGEVQRLPKPEPPLDYGADVEAFHCVQDHAMLLSAVSVEGLQRPSSKHFAQVCGHGRLRDGKLSTAPICS